jgi:hypothetical protein
VLTFGDKEARLRRCVGVVGFGLVSWFGLGVQFSGATSKAVPVICLIKKSEVTKLRVS